MVTEAARGLGWEASICCYHPASRSAPGSMLSTPTQRVSGEMPVPPENRCLVAWPMAGVGGSTCNAVLCTWKSQVQYPACPVKGSQVDGDATQLQLKLE